MCLHIDSTCLEMQHPVVNPLRKNTGEKTIPQIPLKYHSNLSLGCSFKQSGTSGMLMTSHVKLVLIVGTKTMEKV